MAKSKVDYDQLLDDLLAEEAPWHPAAVRLRALALITKCERRESMGGPVRGGKPALRSDDSSLALVRTAVEKRLSGDMDVSNSSEESEEEPTSSEDYEESESAMEEDSSIDEDSCIDDDTCIDEDDTIVSTESSRRKESVSVRTPAKHSRLASLSSRLAAAAAMVSSEEEDESIDSSSTSEDEGEGDSKDEQEEEDSPSSRNERLTSISKRLTAATSILDPEQDQDEDEDDDSSQSEGEEEDVLAPLSKDISHHSDALPKLPPATWKITNPSIPVDVDTVSLTSTMSERNARLKAQQKKQSRPSAGPVDVDMVSLTSTASERHVKLAAMAQRQKKRRLDSKREQDFKIRAAAIPEDQEQEGSSRLTSDQEMMLKVNHIYNEKRGTKIMDYEQLKKERNISSHTTVHNLTNKSGLLDRDPLLGDRGVVRSKSLPKTTKPSDPTLDAAAAAMSNFTKNAGKTNKTRSTLKKVRSFFYKKNKPSDDLAKDFMPSDTHKSKVQQSMLKEMQAVSTTDFTDCSTVYSSSRSHDIFASTRSQEDFLHHGGHVRVLGVASQVNAN